MIPYYNKKFVSTEQLYAKIREELSSYFDAGAVNDLMFPIWTNYALKRLRKSALPIKETTIQICNYKGKLPSDFDSVREAWLCSAIYTEAYQSPTYKYYQTDYRITPIDTSCGSCDCQQDTCICSPCENPNKFLVTHKVTNTVLFSYGFTELLRPANDGTLSRCNTACANRGVKTTETFDVDGCDFITSVEEGVVHLIYYADGIDEEGNQLIPDDIYIQEYIEKYIKYKLYEKLLNSTTDESFNQMSFKYQLADKLQKEAYVLADIELKKDTLDKTRKRITKQHYMYSEHAKLLGLNGYKR